MSFALLPLPHGSCPSILSTCSRSFIQTLKILPLPVFGSPAGRSGFNRICLLPSADGCFVCSIILHFAYIPQSDFILQSSHCVTLAQFAGGSQSNFKPFRCTSLIAITFLPFTFNFIIKFLFLFPIFVSF